MTNVYDDKLTLWSDENGVVVGYMDKIDFDCELGSACGETSIYPSVEDLKKHSPCVKNCGIVEVEVRLRKVIQKGYHD